MKELLTDARFALTLFALAVLFGIIGLLEIKRRHKDIGYVLIYAAVFLLFFSSLVFLYVNYEPAPIRMIIRHY